MGRLTARTMQFFSWTSSLTLACSLCTLTVCGLCQTQSDPVEKTKIGADLHQMGERVAKAVLEKDIQTLLSYGPTNLRAEDEATLKNTRSELYCYIFDSSCVANGQSKWRSVYDKLSHSRNLGITVYLVQSSSDHQTHGNLFFYDRSAVSEKQLASPAFICKEYAEHLASWRFKLEEGKWIAATPFFDYGTEYCDESL